MTKRYGWTNRILTYFIEAQTYEKFLLNQTNFDLTLPAERRIQAKMAIKDEYSFDFAELSPEYSEHELEMQLVNNIRAFLTKYDRFRFGTCNRDELEQTGFINSTFTDTI